MNAIAYILLAIATSTSAAQLTDPLKPYASESPVWEPPQHIHPHTLPKPSVPKEPVNRVRVGDMDIVLEETQMKDVQGRLGGTIGRRGDAAGSLMWLCVHGNDEMGQWAQSKFRTTENNFINKEIAIEEILAMDINRVLDGQEEDEVGNKYNGKILQLQREIREIDDIGRYKYRVIVLANVKGTISPIAADQTRRRLHVRGIKP